MTVDETGDDPGPRQIDLLLDQLRVDRRQALAKPNDAAGSNNEIPLPQWSRGEDQSIAEDAKHIDRPSRGILTRRRSSRVASPGYTRPAVQYSVALDPTSRSLSR